MTATSCRTAVSCYCWLYAHINVEVSACFNLISYAFAQAPHAHVHPSCNTRSHLPLAVPPVIIEQVPLRLSTFSHLFLCFARFSSMPLTPHEHPIFEQVHIQGTRQTFFGYYRSHRRIHRHHQTTKVNTMLDRHRSFLEMLHPPNELSVTRIGEDASQNILIAFSDALISLCFFLPQTWFIVMVGIIYMPFHFHASFLLHFFLFVFHLMSSCSIFLHVENLLPRGGGNT